MYENIQILDNTKQEEDKFAKHGWGTYKTHNNRRATTRSCKR